nr:hypothetical protein [Clostridia bacterium]
MNNNKNKSNKILILCIISSIILVVISIFVFAYAKYKTTLTGATSKQVAKIICEMEVTQEDNSNNSINPYCNVSVKNYNNKNELTETNVTYKIEIQPKGDLVVPEYYWEDSKGVKVAYNTNVVGKLGHESEEVNKYKVVFVNSGESQVTRVVDFNLVAVQED